MGFIVKKQSPLIWASLNSCLHTYKFATAITQYFLFFKHVFSLKVFVFHLKPVRKAQAH